jgi:hypothetical protein
MKSKLKKINIESSNATSVIKKLRAQVAVNLAISVTLIVLTLQIFKGINIDVVKKETHTLQQEIHKINTAVKILKQAVQFSEINADEQSKLFEVYFKDKGVFIQRSKILPQGYLYTVRGDTFTILPLLRQFEIDNTVAHKITAISVTPTVVIAKILIYGSSRLAKITALDSTEQKSSKTLKTTIKPEKEEKEIARLKNLSRLKEKIAHEETLYQLSQAVELIKAKNQLYIEKENCQKIGRCTTEAKKFQSSKKGSSSMSPPPPFKFVITAIANGNVYFHQLEEYFALNQVVINGWKIINILDESVILERQINGATENKTVLLKW